MGNLRSVAKALERAGATVDVSTRLDPTADGLVVPGQGAFGSCVRALGDRLADVRAWIDEGKPYLGICLGLQILFDDSEEEAGAPGTSVLPGSVTRLPDDVKLPHIGWNTIEPVAGSRLFAGVDPGTRFYFVHSFAAPASPDSCAATTAYGRTFCAAVERGSAMATQFHPEKSGDAGQIILRNFIGACA